MSDKRRAVPAKLVSILSQSAKMCERRARRNGQGKQKRVPETTVEFAGTTWSRTCTINGFSAFLAMVWVTTFTAEAVSGVVGVLFPAPALSRKEPGLFGSAFGRREPSLLLFRSRTWRDEAHSLLCPRVSPLP